MLTVAEESTAWGGVSRPVDAGGLGFSQKWNMGWMHDTLEYFGHEAVHRRWHHDLLTFGLIYAWSENYVLPLSHDEVVHLKGSLLNKMPGDPWQRFANLRALYAWMWSHPGKQLLFMGAELAQEREWSQDRELDWHLLADPLPPGRARPGPRAQRRGGRTPGAVVRRCDARGLRLARRQRPPTTRSTRSCAWARRATPGWWPASPTSPRASPRLSDRPARAPGRWVDVLNTDEERWGGSGVVQPEVHTDGTPWQGQPDSAVLTLPPLAARWLVPGP